MDERAMIVTDFLGASVIAGPTGQPQELRLEIADHDGPVSVIFGERIVRQLADVLRDKLQQFQLAGLVGPMA